MIASYFAGTRSPCALKLSPCSYSKWKAGRNARRAWWLRARGDRGQEERRDFWGEEAKASTCKHQPQVMQQKWLLQMFCFILESVSSHRKQVAAQERADPATAAPWLAHRLVHHMQASMHVPHLRRAMRSQQPLLCRSLLRKEGVAVAAFAVAFRPFSNSANWPSSDLTAHKSSRPHTSVSLKFRSTSSHAMACRRAGMSKVAACTRQRPAGRRVQWSASAAQAPGMSPWFDDEPASCILQPQPSPRRPVSCRLAGGTESFHTAHPPMAAAAAA